MEYYFPKLFEASPKTWFGGKLFKLQNKAGQEEGNLIFINLISSVSRLQSLKNKQVNYFPKGMSTLRIIIHCIINIMFEIFNACLINRHVFCILQKTDNILSHDLHGNKPFLRILHWCYRSQIIDCCMFVDRKMFMEEIFANRNSWSSS